MFYIDKPRNSSGVHLEGDFFALDRLYFAIMKFTGFYGIDGRCNFPGCSQAAENLLGLCYEIRHAWQGKRNIVQVYNGIREYWFDDYVEAAACSCGDDDEDDEYGFDDDDGSFDMNIGVFSRADFPDVSSQNTYFSAAFSFPELVFYALVLTDLLRKKDLFMKAAEESMEADEMIRDLNKEYYYFNAETDIARLTMLVKQTLRALYKFIGEDEYIAFMSRFGQFNDFSANCDLEKINRLIVDYSEKEHELDEPKSLMSTLYAFLG